MGNGVGGCTREIPGAERVVELDLVYKHGNSHQVVHLRLVSFLCRIGCM